MGVGESQPYFGLQWVNECFCSDQYGTQGEADIADCDEDGVLDDDGTASLCANGQGNCGWRNAVYSIDNPPPTISVSDGPYFTGDIITVSFTGAENSLDWIGLYAESSTLTEYMDWVYHHGAQDNTGAFTTDGTVTIVLPDQAGMYFVQMLANNGYDPMTAPIEFTVHADGETPFTYLGCFVDSGDRDLNGGGSAVASVPFAAAMECMTRCVGESQPYFGLQWVNECFCSDRYGTQGEADIADCDEDGALDDDGTASLCANGQGNCGWRNAVYGINSGQEPATISISDGPYTPGSTITVTFTGAQSNTDWIGLYAEGSGLQEYMDWVYHHGTQDGSGALVSEGTTDIALPDQEGIYFVQMLANNGYDPMTDPIVFEVTNTAATPTLSASDGPYFAGQALTEYMDWIYHHGTQDGGGELVQSGTVNIVIPAAGDYYIAFLGNNGYVEIADRITIVVGEDNGEGSSDCAEDIDGSGTVDVVDLLALLGAFNNVC